MSQQATAPTVVDLFKKCYGDVQNLLPTDYLLAADIPFSEKQKVGDQYIEAVVLTNETGWTLGGSGTDAFTINPARAGAVKQAKVSPYVSVLGSLIPWSVLSRSAGAGEKAFFDSTKHVVKNNLKSHGKLLEILRIHGQSPSLLGYVSYATATYRGVSFTNGGGALTVNGTSVTFTAGVNTSSKWILLAPGEFAAGIWVGSEGAIVQQVNSSGAVVAQGELLEVDAEMGAIRVDFTPVAASSTTSHRLCFEGMADAKDMIGIHKIMSTSGTLFEIVNTTYSLFKGTLTYAYQPGTTTPGKFTLGKFQNGVALAVNRGGLGGEGDGSGDLETYVNPRTWATLISDEAAKRSHDSSYRGAEVDEGSETITFHHQAGKTKIKTHRMMKEGHAMSLHLPAWSRSGSAEVAMKVPGVDKEIIFPVENTAAMAFRSYADQYIFCHAPAKSIYWTNINDESTT